MNFFSGSFAALLLAIPFAALGQAPSAIISLRGIELGSELKTSTRPECPRESGQYVFPVGDEFRTRMGDKQCWTSMNSFALRLSTPLFAQYQVHNVSEIQGMLSTVGTSIINGRIEAIESVFGRGGYEAFREALVQRYGRFDKEEPIVLQFRTGASIAVRRATWSRPESMLRIDERVESMDVGAVSLYSKTWLDSQRSAKKEVVERARGKL